MKNTTEEVITVEIANGVNSGSGSLTLPEGKIIGVTAFYNGINNPGMVRASIRNNKNFEISKLQHINNYRSREVEYLKDGKPLATTGGQTLKVDVIASQNFTADTEIDFIFIYENEESNGSFC
jgi:predicted RecA/RadA family phage recombinase